MIFVKTLFQIKHFFRVHIKQEELLLNKSEHVFRVQIEKYWHFEAVTPKQYYTFFHT